MSFITSGSHLGAVRSWIQHNFANGESVTWGSQEPLQPLINICSLALEELAQEIRNAVIREVFQYIPICNSFEYSEKSFIVCKNCGFLEILHDMKKGER